MVRNKKSKSNRNNGCHGNQGKKLDRVLSSPISTKENFKTEWFKSKQTQDQGIFRRRGSKEDQRTSSHLGGWWPQKNFFIYEKQLLQSSVWAVRGRKVLKIVPQSSSSDRKVRRVMAISSGKNKSKLCSSQFGRAKKTFKSSNPKVKWSTLLRRQD